MSTLSFALLADSDGGGVATTGWPMVRRRYDNAMMDRRALGMTFSWKEEASFAPSYKLRHTMESNRSPVRGSPHDEGKKKRTNRGVCSFPVNK